MDKGKPTPNHLAETFASLLDEEDDRPRLDLCGIPNNELTFPAASANSCGNSASTQDHRSIGSSHRVSKSTRSVIPRLPHDWV
jgi:hypothetical protein